jgi:hypothetical protein
VPLGLIVTLLCGIARNSEVVFTDVLALGATDWVARLLVVPVVVLLVCATARPPAVAKTTATAMRLSLFLINYVSKSWTRKCLEARAPRNVSGMPQAPTACSYNIFFRSLIRFADLGTLALTYSIERMTTPASPPTLLPQ